MSKIALEGNASGTGTFTIASPNSNSNYTLTLPSSTGTVVVTGGAQTIEFAAGTAASPSITFTGDTNTGIFSPGADTIAFAEGGAEAMRITSAGSVGIGTSSPNATLHVQGSGTTDGSIVFNQQLTATTAYNSSPQSGSMVSLKYNTGGDFAGMGGWSIIKENGTDGNFAGAMLFHTRANGGAITERMRIDSSGNVGIGTTSPDHRLDIDGGSLCVNGFADSANNYITLRNGFSPSSGGGIGFRAIDHSGSNADGLGCYGHDGISFLTSQTERARITSGGELLVRKTTYSDSGTVGCYLAYDGSVGSTRAETSNTHSSYNLYSTGASAYRFYVGMAGTIYATSTTISAISDQRLKENIQDIDVGLDAVMALKPRKFDWKEGKGKDKKGDRGWIAQEFEQVFPDMIDVWKDEPPEGEEPYKAVNADLIPVLVKAIQELKAITDAQATRIEALEAEVAALKGQ